MTSKLTFRARTLDASRPLSILYIEDLPELTDLNAINRSVPAMPSGMEKEEEAEKHLQVILEQQEIDVTTSLFNTVINKTSGGSNNVSSADQVDSSAAQNNKHTKSSDECKETKFTSQNIDNVDNLSFKKEESAARSDSVDEVQEDVLDVSADKNNKLTLIIPTPEVFHVVGNCTTSGGGVDSASSKDDSVKKEKTDDGESVVVAAASDTKEIKSGDENLPENDDKWDYDTLYSGDYILPKNNIHIQPFSFEQDSLPDYDMDFEDKTLYDSIKKMPDSTSATELPDEAAADDSTTSKLVKDSVSPPSCFFFFDSLSHLSFECMIDQLEKSCGVHHTVTLREAKMLLKEDDDLIKLVYDYWVEKRSKTRIPLLPVVKTVACSSAPLSIPMSNSSSSLNFESLIHESSTPSLLLQDSSGGINLSSSGAMSIGGGQMMSSVVAANAAATTTTGNVNSSQINNPYVAFRRRTEKMQTRKNRKNDETSYEKMLKLRRDLSKAVTLLDMVRRREKSKKEHLNLTFDIFEKRYQKCVWECSTMRNIHHSVSASRGLRKMEQVVVQDHHHQSEEIDSAHDENKFSGWGGGEVVHKDAVIHRRNVVATKGTSAKQSSTKRMNHASSKHSALYGKGVNATMSQSHHEMIDDSVSNINLGSCWWLPGPSGSSYPQTGPYAFKRKSGVQYYAPKLDEEGGEILLTENSCYRSSLDSSPFQGLWPWEGVPQQSGDLRDKYAYKLATLKRSRVDSGVHFVGYVRRRVGRGGRVIFDRTSSNPSGKSMEQLFDMYQNGVFDGESSSSIKRSKLTHDDAICYRGGGGGVSRPLDSVSVHKVASAVVSPSQLNVY